MTPQGSITRDGEYAAKLALIAKLTADELVGWNDCRKQLGYREGEKAAIMSRAKELGVKL